VTEEVLLRLAVIGALIAATLTFFVHRLRARQRAWREAAGKAGLEDVVDARRPWHLGSALTGRSGPLRVRFATDGVPLRIDGLGAGADALTLLPEGFGRRIFGSEIEVGDPAFDAEVYVHAPAPLALALLDHPTRGQLAALLRGEAGDTPLLRAVVEEEADRLSRAGLQPSEASPPAAEGGVGHRRPAAEKG
jgi:hypothetical protein